MQYNKPFVKCIECGATFIGLVFVESSKRNINVDKAQLIVETIHKKY